MTLSELDLTAEQQAIVDHPVAPLRIAAGAGTGKTTTVVARIVTLIRTHGIVPEAVLGMTFTNKAAAELADRLRIELPALAIDGREVEVTTYHGFGLRILSEFGSLIGIERDLDVVGSGYVRQLLIESVGDEPYRHLDMTKARHRLDDAANLRSQMVENLVSIERLRSVAPDTGGDQHEDRQELLRILERYEERKRRLGVVDYGDLIANAHRLVMEYPEIARRIGDRYTTVVLDEYQDTDPAQRELLREVFGGGFPITAVGDADQTIYEWRGASLENFASFPRHFPTTAGTPAPSLPLSLNRRSDRAILDLANVIRRDISGIDDAASVELVPAPEADAGEVAVGWFRTDLDEANWIAQEIQRSVSEDDADWCDIAILFRRNSSMAVVSEALRVAGVPHEVASLGGLLDVPEVAEIHAWLRVLGRPEDTTSLMRLLLGARFRLGLSDLVPLANAVRHRKRSRDTDDELAYPMLEAIEHLESVSGLRSEAAERLAEFRVSYRRLLRLAQSMTLSELVRRIVDEIDGWAEIESMDAATGLTARLNVYRFIDLTESWSPLSGRPSLDAFLEYLDLLDEETTAQELDTARLGSDNAVSLLTVHRSKGLEWDTVFLPALAKGVFPAGSRAFDLPEARARWLPYELRLDQATYATVPPDTKGRRDWQRGRHLDQEHRTAYVAVTRARHRLNLTGAMWAGSVENPRAPSAYLEAARGTGLARTVVWADDPGERPTRRPVPAANPDPLFMEGWRAAVMSTIEDPSWPERTAGEDTAFAKQREQLELLLDGLPVAQDAASPQDLVTSVTGLTTLASCPRRFYWSEIDPLPRRPSPAMARGTRVHRAIELHHRGVASFEELSIDAPTVGERDGSPSVDPFEVFLTSRFATATPIMVEAPINIDIGGVRVRGRVDAVFEPRPGTWEIVDYKSGRRSSSPAASVQLDAYALAAADGALGQRRPDRIVTTFLYLGSDPPVEESTELDDSALATVRHRLHTLAVAAQSETFDTAPSPGCRSCPFSDVCTDGAAWLRDNV